jgi:hypothetical protein
MASAWLGSRRARISSAMASAWLGSRRARISPPRSPSRAADCPYLSSRRALYRRPRRRQGAMLARGAKALRPGTCTLRPGLRQGTCTGRARCARGRRASTRIRGAKERTPRTTDECTHVARVCHCVCHSHSVCMPTDRSFMRAPSTMHIVKCVRTTQVCGAGDSHVGSDSQYRL